jgi:hypothetical protein
MHNRIACGGAGTSSQRIPSIHPCCFVPGLVWFMHKLYAYIYVCFTHTYMHKVCIYILTVTACLLLPSSCILYVCRLLLAVGYKVQMHEEQLVFCVCSSFLRRLAAVGRRSLLFLRRLIAVGRRLLLGRRRLCFSFLRRLTADEQARSSFACSPSVVVVRSPSSVVVCFPLLVKHKSSVVKHDCLVHRNCSRFTVEWGRVKTVKHK